MYLLCHPSCASSPSAVNSYIAGEVSAGRMIRLAHRVHASPIGLVPKCHSGVTWRMTVDLSSPRGRSLNDLISPDLCSLSYPSVDNAVDFIVSFGRYTQLVKIDLNK